MTELVFEVTQEEDGGYCAECLTLDIFTQADTWDELRANVRVAGRFAQVWNGLARATGHLWQNRFYSCPAEWPAVDRVIRYVECNAVRAGLVQDPAVWRWSSARAHQGGPEEFGVLDLDWWTQRSTARAWSEFRRQPSETDALTHRRATHAGRPFGSAAFVEDLECRLGRALRPRPGGQPPKANAVGSPGP